MLYATNFQITVGINNGYGGTLLLTTTGSFASTQPVFTDSPYLTAGNIIFSASDDTRTTNVMLCATKFLNTVGINYGVLKASIAGWPAPSTPFCASARNGLQFRSIQNRAALIKVDQPAAYSVALLRDSPRCLPSWAVANPYGTVGQKTGQRTMTMSQRDLVWSVIVSSQLLVSVSTRFQPISCDFNMPLLSTTTVRADTSPTSHLADLLPFHPPASSTSQLSMSKCNLESLSTVCASQFPALALYVPLFPALAPNAQKFPPFDLHAQQRPAFALYVH